MFALHKYLPTFAREYIFLLSILTLEKIIFPLMFMNFLFFVFIFVIVTHHRLSYFLENNMTENIAHLRRNHVDRLTILDKYVIGQKCSVSILYRCVIHGLLRHLRKNVDFIAFIYTMSAVMCND